MKVVEFDERQIGFASGIIAHGAGPRLKRRRRVLRKHPDTPAAGAAARRAGAWITLMALLMSVNCCWMLLTCAVRSATALRTSDVSLATLSTLAARPATGVRRSRQFARQSLADAARSAR